MMKKQMAALMLGLTVAAASGMCMNAEAAANKVVVAVAAYHTRHIRIKEYRYKIKNEFALSDVFFVFGFCDEIAV